jgi:TRAP transporter 4TM/12TM fusion protein
VSAILPAVLSLTGIFLMVHFEAKKLGLAGLPRESIPHFGRLFITKGYLFLPVVVLIAMMGLGFTPAYAACFGILSAFLVSLIRKETRITPKGLVEALSSGSRNTIGIAMACAIAGTIVGIVSLTGIGQFLIGRLISVVNYPFFIQTGTSLVIALVITMFTCLVLGMGIPTTANYVIMATITAPMVIRAGTATGYAVPILAAHMCVFYFGIIADITPPVALAAYAGAAIAKGDPMKTGITATRLAITAFIIPYIFVFSPAILMINTNPWEVIRIVLSAFTGMVSLAAGLEGFMLRKVPVLLRLAAVAGGLSLIDPGLISDLVGFGLIALVVATQVIDLKKEKSLS